MLEDNSYKDIVRWTISGDSFVVVDVSFFLFIAWIVYIKYEKTLELIDVPIMY